MVLVNEYLVIGELQQVSKVCVVEGLLSNFKLVPECHTHPENQIRSSMIGFIGMKDSGRVKADLMLLGCVWHSVANIW